MKIYIAAPRQDVVSMMIKRTSHILSSYYYHGIDRLEIKPLQKIIKHNERIRNETEKRRTCSSTRKS
jgi:ferritin-like protein